MLATPERSSRRPRRPATGPEPSTPFVDLGVDAALARVLSRADITEPSPIQREAIPPALEGRDLCGKARTGSGKTLAFGLPLIQRITPAAPGAPHALVLVPTRELAQQVTRELSPLAAVRKLKVAAIFGGAPMPRQVRSLQDGVDIVVATPGRLFDLMERGDVSVAQLQVVVLDEADQMADMGFLPQVRRILDRATEPRQTLLFSATLDGDVDQLVRRYQHDPIYCEVEPPAGEEDVTMLHRFIGVTRDEKLPVAVALCSGPERTLLFVRTQRAAERLSRQLELQGVPNGLLHGGLAQPRRDRALRAFTSGEIRVLVATNVAARGIHVDGVDTVIHYDPPEETKVYLHRSGRTARAGASGVVVTLVTFEDADLVASLRREAGLSEAVVEMDRHDPRLRDLAGWTPPQEDPRNLAPKLVFAGSRAGRGRRGVTGWDRPRRTASTAPRPPIVPVAVRPAVNRDAPFGHRRRPQSPA